MHMYETSFIIFLITYLLIGAVFKWFMSQTPYLIHYYTITPYITSTGITLEMQSLVIMMHNTIELVFSV